MYLTKVYAYLKVNEREDEKGEEREKLERFVENNHIEIADFVVEIISGSTKAENRPKFVNLVKRLNRGDIIITTEFNRIGRYIEDSVEVFQTLMNSGVKMCIIENNFFNSWRLIQDDALYAVVAKLFIEVKKEAAEQQQMRISNRTTLAMHKLQNQGRKVGRPPQMLPPEDFISNYKQYIGSGMLSGFSLNQFCQFCGISKSCYYNWVRKIESAGIL